MKFLLHRKYLLTIIIISVIGVVSYSQCPMCKMSAESNLKAGGTEGSALNSGILYLLTLPYLAITVIGFLWYKNRKKLQSEERDN